MTKIEKLIAKLLSNPKDFSWDDLVKVLRYYGYTEMTGRGSRRKFVNKNGRVISLHEPHPDKIIKPYVIKLVVEHLNLK